MAKENTHLKGFIEYLLEESLLCENMTVSEFAGGRDFNP